jgi:hypothetical protein
METIKAQATSALVNTQALPAADTLPLAAASPADVSRFAALMNPAGTPKAAVAPAPVAGMAATDSGSLGDAILKGIRGVSEGFHAKSKSVDDFVAREDFSPSKLLTIQKQFHESHIESQLVVNAISTGGRHLDTLVKQN